jgi:hypothetical protein
VYGGNNDGGHPSDDLVVLDTTQTIFTWSRAVSTNPPPPRFYHTATLVGDYMIVAFGKTDYLPSPESNEIFFLYTGDKSDYKWVDEFISPFPPSNSSNPSATCEINNNQSINRNLLIGVITLSTVLALVGGSFLIRLYIKRRQSRPDVLISGSS